MVTTMAKELYEIGQQPPIGEVPAKMNAWLIRENRFGQPTSSFQKEVVDVPAIGDDEVLVYVMAAGVNYNNVWAALGIPVNVIKARQKAGEKEDFHIGGSDASGHRLQGRQGRHERQGRRRGGHPLRDVGPQRSRGRPARIRCIRPRSGSGATRPTGAASRSSPRCRRTSACRSRST